jgi:hypothetical protein
MKKLKVVFKDGKPAELIENFSDDFFKQFGEETEKAWETAKNAAHEEAKKWDALPEKVRVLEREILKPQDKPKPFLNCVIANAFKERVNYLCICCGSTIKPQNFKTFKAFKRAVYSHSNAHAETKTKPSTSRLIHKQPKNNLL